jgi:hypothetical protein
VSGCWHAGAHHTCERTYRYMTRTHTHTEQIYARTHEHRAHSLARTHAHTHAHAHTHTHRYIHIHAPTQLGVPVLIKKVAVPFLLMPSTNAPVCCWEIIHPPSCPSKKNIFLLAQTLTFNVCVPILQRCVPKLPVHLAQLGVNGNRISCNSVPFMPEGGGARPFAW